jgi:hypothetical protein
MAIDFVNEIWEGRSGRVTRAGVREYSKAFRVRTTTFVTDAAEVAVAVDPASALAIPTVGDSFGPNDVEAIATSVGPTQQAIDPRIWVVSVDYSSNPGGATSTEPEDPLDRAPVESLTFSRTTSPLDRDVDGKELRNSAGDMFDPLPEVEVARPVLKIQRNEAGFAYTTAVQFVNSVNSKTFRGAAVGEARMVSISATSKFENGVSYHDVSYGIEFLRGGWALDIVDRGYRILKAGVPTIALDPAEDTLGNDQGAQGSPEPSNLNGSGALLAAAAPLFIHTFQPYTSEDFDALGL